MNPRPGAHLSPLSWRMLFAGAVVAALVYLAPAHGADGPAGRVGPRVSPELLANDSTGNPHRAQAQLTPSILPQPCAGTRAADGSCMNAGTHCEAGQALEWTVGAARCLGTGTAQSAGNSITVAATGVNGGSAQFMCQAGGSFAVVGVAQCGPSGSSNGGRSCGSLPLGTGWNAGNLYCEIASDSPELKSGQTVQLSDNSGLFQGSAVLNCQDGAALVVNANCQQVAGGVPACSAVSGSWSAEGNVCVGSLLNADLGMIASALDTRVSADGGTPGATGASEYQCTASGWARTSTPASCRLAATSCPPGLKFWGPGGSECSASLAERASGQVISVFNSNATHVGSASYLCQADGSFALQAGANCTPSPVGCAAATREWGVGVGQWCGAPGDGSQCCRASYGVIPHGGSLLVSDQTGPTTGAVTVSCTNGVPDYSQLQCSAANQCPGVPAGIFRESDFACRQGADQLNDKVPATAQGETVNINFPGSPTWYQLRCQSPGGANFGYVPTGVYSCQ
ncbi:MAG: hypothetical protein Q7T63_21830 [Burkholderiaceae bacterium]|nr:hypothetical protein [Burkholderiaceae bacterium]